MKQSGKLLGSIFNSHLPGFGSALPPDQNMQACARECLKTGCFKLAASVRKLCTIWRPTKSRGLGAACAELDFESINACTEG